MFSELAVVEHQAHDERDAANPERVKLGQELATGTAGAIRKADVRRAVDHRQADGGDDEYGSEQEPIHVEVKASFEQFSR
jgi:hypothetical protein